MDTRATREHGVLDKARAAALERLISMPPARALSRDLARFQVLLSVLFAYLYRVSGQSSLAIGTLVPTRPTPRSRGALGMFVEMLPIRVDIEPDETFGSLLAKVAVQTRACLAHAVPGAGAGVPARQLSIVMNYVPVHVDGLDGMPVSAEWLHGGHVDRHHVLRLQATDWNATGSPSVAFDCDDARFTAVERGAVVAHWRALFDAMVRDVDTPIDAVDIVAAAAAAGAVERPAEDDGTFGSRRANTRRDSPAERPEASAATSIVGRFESVARRFSAEPAVSEAGRTLSYAELDARANAVAVALGHHGVGEGDRVALFVRRSLALPACALGILKSGAAYVPIDATTPLERLRFLLDDANVDAALSEPSLTGSLDAAATLPLVLVNDDARIIDERGTDPAPPSADGGADGGSGGGSGGGDTGTDGHLDRAPPPGSATAYCLYTSGSTGTPKGVVVSHAALSNYCLWALDRYAGGRRSSFPLFTPIGFDLTVTSLFVPLLGGGHLRVYPERDTSRGDALLDVVDEDAVDIVKLTPAHLALIAERDLARSRIAQLIVGGEDLKCAVAQRIHRAFGGDVVIHNEYGPTEATVGCIVHRFDPSRDTYGSVPIGRAVAGMRAHVLNARRLAQPDGVPGELYLSGPSLADGYHGRPELDREHFIATGEDGPRLYRTGDIVRRDAHGELVYLGRRDEQVKVRGARVELAEIEAAALAHPGVDGCVVTLTGRAAEEGGATERHCVRCGLSSRYPDATIDTSGLCSLCTGFERYHHRAETYFRPMSELEALAGRVRHGRGTRRHDCMMLLSGGKDSSYALARLVDLGLSVLAYTLDNGYLSPEAMANVRRVCDALGVEHEFGRTPAMPAIFVDSLQRHSNVCNGCFKTIYTLSMKRAHELGVPYVFTGLSRGQFFETRLTEELFTQPDIDVSRIDDIVLGARKAYHRTRDAVSTLLDTEHFADERIFEEVRVIDFYRYCPVDLDEMLHYLKTRLPWVRPADTGRSTNCLINDVGIHVHKRERGYHNYALPYSWDVRLGHKTREAALDELDDDIDEARVQGILDELGYTCRAPAGEAERRLALYYTPGPSSPSPPPSDTTVAATASPGGASGTERRGSRTNGSGNEGGRGDADAAEPGGGATPVPARPPGPTPEQLRHWLTQRLATWSMPSWLMPLDALPLSDNGKVRRSALPEPLAERALDGVEYVAPASAIEREMADVWRAQLGIDRVGVRDNFFDLGGDSLQAIRIVAELNRRGHALRTTDLFEHQSIAELAARHERRLAGSSRTEAAETGDVADGGTPRARVRLAEGRSARQAVATAAGRVVGGGVTGERPAGPPAGPLAGAFGELALDQLRQRARVRLLDQADVVARNLANHELAACQPCPAHRRVGAYRRRALARTEVDHPAAVRAQAVVEPFVGRRDGGRPAVAVPLVGVSVGARGTRPHVGRLAAGELDALQERGQRDVGRVHRQLQHQHDRAVDEAIERAASGAHGTHERPRPREPRRRSRDGRARAGCVPVSCRSGRRRPGGDVGRCLFRPVRPCRHPPARDLRDGGVDRGRGDARDPSLPSAQSPGARPGAVAERRQQTRQRRQQPRVVGPDAVEHDQHGHRVPARLEMLPQPPGQRTAAGESGQMERTGRLHAQHLVDEVLGQRLRRRSLEQQPGRESVERSRRPEPGREVAVHQQVGGGVGDEQRRRVTAGPDRDQRVRQFPGHSARRRRRRRARWRVRQRERGRRRSGRHARQGFRRERHGRHRLARRRRRRHRRLAITCRRDRRRVYRDGQGTHRGVREQRRHRQAYAELRLDPREQPDRVQRRPSQGEEVVVGGDAPDAEHAPPHRLQPLVGGESGSGSRSGRPRPRPRCGCGCGCRCGCGCGCGCERSCRQPGRCRIGRCAPAPPDPFRQRHAGRADRLAQQSLRPSQQLVERGGIGLAAACDQLQRETRSGLDEQGQRRVADDAGTDLAELERLERATSRPVLHHQHAVVQGARHLGPAVHGHRVDVSVRHGGEVSRADVLQPREQRSVPVRAKPHRLHVDQHADDALDVRQRDLPAGHRRAEQHVRLAAAAAQQSGPDTLHDAARRQAGAPHEVVQRLAVGHRQHELPARVDTGVRASGVGRVRATEAETEVRAGVGARRTGGRNGRSAATAEEHGQRRAPWKTAQRVAPERFGRRRVLPRAPAREALERRCARSRRRPSPTQRLVVLQHVVDDDGAGPAVEQQVVTGPDELVRRLLEADQRDAEDRRARQRQRRGQVGAQPAREPRPRRLVAPLRSSASTVGGAVAHAAVPAVAVTAAPVERRPRQRHLPRDHLHRPPDLLPVHARAQARVTRDDRLPGVTQQRRVELAAQGAAHLDQAGIDRRLEAVPQERLLHRGQREDRLDLHAVRGAALSRHWRAPGTAGCPSADPRSRPRRPAARDRTRAAARSGAPSRAGGRS